MNVSEVAASMSLDEDRVRQVCDKFGLLDEASGEVENLSALRLAIELEDVKNSQLDCKNNGLRWTEKVSAIAAFVAALCALAAVAVSSVQFRGAVETFRTGNQYQFQNDFVSAFESMNDQNPSATLLSLNERLRLGRQMQKENGFPGGFWSEYTQRVCKGLTAAQCKPVTGGPSQPTAYKNSFNGFSEIIEVCYSELSSNQDLCAQQGD